MDLDPNYDPSDFLKMPSSNKDNLSAQSQPEQIDPESLQSSSYQEQPFNMSEMLQYKIEEKDEELNPPETFVAEEQLTQEAPSAPQPETADHVAIHDDLAISDSDEDDNPRGETQKKEISENENEEDGDGLWF